MIMIDKAIANQSPKAQGRFASSFLSDGCTPDGWPGASMTIPFVCYWKGPALRHFEIANGMCRLR